MKIKTSNEESAVTPRKGPSRMARILATTALNHCVSYYGRANVYELAMKMDYCLQTGKSIRRTR